MKPEILKIKTSELEGAALDWAVATCECLPIRHDPMNFGPAFAEGGFWVWDERGPIGKRDYRLIGRQYSPSNNWSQGGPIIEQEGINLFKHNKLDVNEPDKWCGHKVVPRPNMEGGFNMTAIAPDGPTPLIAAMRCYVASKLGDEVDVPEELL